MRRTVESGFSALAGAAMGAAILYLLDPTHGHRRRTQLITSARSAVDGVADSMQRASRAVHGNGHAAVAQASGALATARDAISAATSALTNRASDWAQRAADVANDASDDIVDTERDWVNRASLALGRPRDAHYGSSSALAVGSLALGAGLSWAFDPQLGRGRRAWIRDKSYRVARETADFFRRTGRHLANRGRGVAARTRRLARDTAGSATSEWPHESAPGSKPGIEPARSPVDEAGDVAERTGM